MDVTATTTTDYSIDDDALKALIEPLIPAPIPGADGKDGADGAVGPQGPQGETGPEGPQGPAGASGTGSSFFNELFLDGQPGATDDAKLDSAIAAMVNGSVTRPILLSPRVHTINNGRNVKDGMKLIAFGVGDQPRGADSIPCQIIWTGTGAMWTVDHTTYNVQFQGIGFQATNKGSFIVSSGTNVLWCSYFRDLGFVGFNGVFGSASAKLYNDAIIADGWCNINNPTGTSINIGGSDSTFLWTRCLIDAPDGGAMPEGQYHIIVDHQQKTTISGIYMTCSAAEGIRFVGSNTDGAMHLINSVFEGRNTNDMAYDQLIRVESGRVYVGHCNFDFSKSGTSFITVTGGTVVVSDCDFVPSTTWAASPTKFANVSSGATLVFRDCYSPAGAVTA